MTVNPGNRVREIINATRNISPPPSTDQTRESSLVDLSLAAPGIRVDLRYATENNFLGHILYDGKTALLQEPVTESLTRVQILLSSQGLGLIVYDAYRPWWVTKVFWDVMPIDSRTFLADPALGSKHNRGCAVDVGLIESGTGKILPMPSAFDEFSERAFVSYSKGTDEERANRDLLISTMGQESFSVISAEWWHFDHDLWPKYPILNEPVPK